MSADGGSAADERGKWAQSAKALIGEVVGGKYKIEKIIGRGGMGTIYIAEQQPLGRKVAVKLLHSNLGGGDADPEFQKRFLLEAATLSQLAHPNIVVVHDYGSLEGDEAACFMVMEHLGGKTINEVLAVEPTFAPARALRITREIARALRAAHDLGVIHRDLKSANVMLSPGPEGELVKVLDFGLVKVMRDDSEELTAEGRFLGSPRYMSPEQIMRLPLDGRSDLYSLGIMLYRMLSGDVPFLGDHAVQTLMAHLSQPVPRMQDKTGVAVPAAVEAIVMRLLEKEAADRYASATDLIQEIDRLWPQLSEEPLVMSGEYLRPSGLGLGAEPTPPSMSGPFLKPSSYARPSEPNEASPSSSGHTGSDAIGAEATGGSMVAAPLEPLERAGEIGEGEATSPRARVAMVAIVLLGLLTGIGGAAAVMGLLEEPPADPSRSSTATADPAQPTPVDPLGGPAVAVAPLVPAPADPDPAPPEPTPPEPGGFTLTIESDPSGAAVTRDGERLGETPLTLPLDAAAFRDGQPTFTLRHRGRAPFVFTQEPSAVDVTVVGQLPRLRRAEPRPPSGDGPSGSDMSIKTSR